MFAAAVPQRRTVHPPRPQPEAMEAVTFDRKRLEQWLAEDETLRAAADAALKPLELPVQYVPYAPTVKQEWFLLADALEAFFGGAAGPGKSWGLLMAGLQYVETPGYHGLLLRPQLNEFEQPGGLIEVSHDWLDTTDASWNGTRREWAFPSGATLRFGYLSAPGHLRQYKGPSYSFCGFDELTGFQEWAYRAMFRVLRQPRNDALSTVPLRMRSASNPGDIGHAWVKSRFIEAASRVPEAVYVRALITDNPHIDYDEYLKSLAHLSAIDRARLIAGDWDVAEEGGTFTRDRFVIVDAEEVEPPVKVVRYWDLAATEPTPGNMNPDWTGGLRLQLDRNGIFTVTHLVHGQWGPGAVEAQVQQTAEEDGRHVSVWIEQEPGASGKLLVKHFQREVLRGFACHAGLTRSQDKETRARPVAAAVSNGLVQVVRGPHLHTFLDQVSIFPLGDHDDLVDSFSGAHYALTRTGSAAGAKTSVPRARIPTSAVERASAQTRY